MLLEPHDTSPTALLLVILVAPPTPASKYLVTSTYGRGTQKVFELSGIKHLNIYRQLKCSQRALAMDHSVHILLPQERFVPDDRRHNVPLVNCDLKTLCVQAYGELNKHIFVGSRDFSVISRFFFLGGVNSQTLHG